MFQLEGNTTTTSYDTPTTNRPKFYMPPWVVVLLVVALCLRFGILGFSFPWAAHQEQDVAPVVATESAVNDSEEQPVADAGEDDIVRMVLGKICAVVIPLCCLGMGWSFIQIIFGSESTLQRAIKRTWVLLAVTAVTVIIPVIYDVASQQFVA